MALWGCLVLVACCELAALDCLAFREASLLRQLWHKSIEAWRRTAGLRFGSLVVSLLLLIWAILRQEEFDLDRQAKFFDILLKIVSISGIAAGAVWSFNAFLRQRLAASRLTVKQEIHPIQLPDGRWLLKVHVTVSNVGQVQVTLRRWRLYADQILPLTEDVEKLDLPEGAYTDKQAHWECFKDGDFKDERAFRMRRTRRDRRRHCQLGRAFGYPSGTNLLSSMGTRRWLFSQGRPEWLAMSNSGRLASQKRCQGRGP